MNGSKEDRQNKIVELIAENEIETQDELNVFLTKAGFFVTQATVSRDIRELRLIKKSVGGNKLIYSVFTPQDDALLKAEKFNKFMRILRDGIVSMQCVQNILVIKTLEGLAMGVAESVDALEEPDIIGTIAGDNTIFCVVKSNKRGNLLIKKIGSIVNSR